MLAGRTYLDDVPLALRNGIKLAHEQYHSQTEERPFSAGQAFIIGKTLLTSAVADHQFDAGWLLVQAALDSTNPELACQDLKLAHRAWQAAHDIAPDAETMLRSQLASAYIPAFGEQIKGVPTNHSALMRRLLGLNTLVVGAHRRGERVVGVAAEIAVATLLVRHHPHDPQQRLAQPSPSWQDNHGSKAASGLNFDVSYGLFPATEHRIQVKADPVAAHPSNSNFNKWRRQYDKSIAIVSGGIHLGNSTSHPVAINETLIKTPSPEKEAYLDNVTLNILDQIALVENA